MSNPVTIPCVTTTVLLVTVLTEGVLITERIVTEEQTMFTVTEAFPVEI